MNKLASSKSLTYVIPGLIDDVANPVPSRVNEVVSGRGNDYMSLLSALESSGFYDMPALHGCASVEVGTPLAFHEARAMYNKGYSLKGHFVHFYVDDKVFECFRNNPDKYIPMLRSADFVISPDWSTYRNYPFPYVLKNVFDNNLLAAHMEREGVVVVPNVVWCKPMYYEYTFAGLPRNSVVCVSSNALSLNDKKGVELWLHGYGEAMNILAPPVALRFGKVVPGEEGINPHPVRVAVSNPYIARLRNGG